MHVNEFVQSRFLDGSSQIIQYQIVHVPTYLGVAGKLTISLDIFGQISVEFFLHQLSRGCFFTQLTFGNCVKIPRLEKYTQA